MPLQKLQFRPGVNREGTDYSNEGGWYDCDHIRFRSGFPEKIGGWSRLSNNTFLGDARALWNWVDLNANNYVGVGTNVKYYIEKGGSYNDITPYTNPSGTALAANPFSTTNGSNIVNVTDGTNSPSIGDYVVFSGATAVGGLTINGEYAVTGKISSTVYQITAASNATSTATGGGAGVTAYYELATGLDVYTVSNGWGAGQWSPTITVTLTNPFATTNTSTTVTVTQTAHGLSTGNYVAFQGASTVGGVPAALLNITFPITVTGVNTYTITVQKAATSTTTGGGTVTVYPQYGTRGWGAAATVGIGSQLRLWSNDNYGQNLVIAPRGGAIYYWQAASGISVRAQTLSSLSTSNGYSGSYVPTSTYQVVSSAIQRFVIAFGANPYQAGVPNTTFNPMLVRWSDQNNEYQWVPDVTNQSGEFALTNGSYIMGARATRQEILVWTDSAIYSMQYLGAPYVWGFQVLMDNISIISPNCMVTVNNVTYWMGVDKFYMYSGRVETLPCSIRQYIFDDINYNQSYQIFAGANEGYNEVWWFYVSNTSNGTAIDKYVIYNYLDRVWYYGTMARTAWLETGIQQYPIAADYNGRLLYHESAVDDISGLTPVPIDAYIQSSDFDIGDGHNFGFVWRILPDVNFNGSIVNSPYVTMTVKPRQNSGTPYGTADNPQVISGNNYSASRVYNIQQFTGQVYTRLRGRQMAFRIESDSLGVSWQLGSPRIDIRPDGRR